jgi:hypothetical protein
MDYKRKNGVYKITLGETKVDSFLPVIKVAIKFKTTAE